MYSAFKAVIQDSSFPSVDGLVLPLCSHKGRFCYMCYADILTDNLSNDEKGGKAPISFGTAPGGGCSVELGNDGVDDCDGRNVGYFFLQGKFGVVFPASKDGFRAATIIKVENQAYWAIETQRLLGKPILSFYLTEQHCGAIGEKLLGKKKCDEAEFLI